MRSRALSLAALLGIGAMAFAAPAAAQERSCDLIESGRAEQREVGGAPVLEFYDPFYFRCTDGAELRANRGTLNQVTGLIELRGSVFFEDPLRTLTADEATYESAPGRLFATGNVVFVNRQEGSTLRGPELEYFRPMEGRPEPRVNARQRPHLTLQPREAAAESEPLEVDADQVTITGEDQLEASGSVVITRTDLLATSRQATYSGATGNLELRGDAEIDSGEYDLAGDVVQARMVDGVLEHVRAHNNASLTGEDLTVTAPDLQLFFAAELLQRAVATVGAGGDPAGPRAVATSTTFRIQADSIDALIPAQQVERVIAIGSARGESIDTTAAVVAPRAADIIPSPDDSLVVADVPRELRAAAPALIENDWIRGDTIIGFFAAADTTGEAADTAVTLERIVARGSALSLYRVDREATPTGRGRMNFLSGEQIELTFANGELELAEVEGLQKGLFLDPVAPAPDPEQTASRSGGGG